MLLAGRGFGKTRLAAEDSWWYLHRHPGHRMALVAPTARDLRIVCLEGESGLLSCIPPELCHGGSPEKAYNRSLAELKLANGSVIQGFTGEEPGRLRGPQFHRAWCDELAAWQYPQETYDMLQFGLRLGDRPRALVTTTPKPIPLIKSLAKLNTTEVVRGTTFENKANLAPAFFKALTQYDGTALGRQELYAEILEDAGGIFKRAWFQLWPAAKGLPVFEFVVQSYDTAFTEKTQGDPTACTVWGIFKPPDEDRWAVMLLDAWDEQLPYHELRARVVDEFDTEYGAPKWAPEGWSAPVIGDKPKECGRTADCVLIEAKGSGLSLLQELRATTRIPARPYNPGRADKVQRAHRVSHLLEDGLVWVPESGKRPGTAVGWADKVIEQCLGFPNGEHDDYVDTLTQALALLADQTWLTHSDDPEPDPEDDWRPERVNPYAV